MPGKTSLLLRRCDSFKKGAFFSHSLSSTLKRYRALFKSGNRQLSSRKIDNIKDEKCNPKRKDLESFKLAHFPESTRHLSSASNGTQKNGYIKDDIEVAHEDELYLAVNKPVGLSVLGASADNQRDTANLSFDQKIRQGFEMPQKELHLGVSLKSFYSGLVLFCRTKCSKQRLKRYLSWTATERTPFLSYLAITVGKPQCPENYPLSSYISRVYLHQREMSVIGETNSKNARKEGAMMETSYTLRTLASNDESGTALVDIRINKDKWDALPLLLVSFLSPVLGDHIYSSRCHSVMGVPFLLQPHAAKPGTQQLPYQISQALPSKYQDAAEMPLFLHRHQISLPSSENPRSSPLIISAPPSKDFINILKCLGLHRDDFSAYFKNSANKT